MYGVEVGITFAYFIIAKVNNLDAIFGRERQIFVVLGKSQTPDLTNLEKIQERPFNQPTVQYHPIKFLLTQ
jgi:hypothetical protein